MYGKVIDEAEGGCRSAGKGIWRSSRPGVRIRISDYRAAAIAGYRRARLWHSLLLYCFDPFISYLLFTPSSTV
jgi:hypothetical protein